MVRLLADVVPGERAQYGTTRDPEAMAPNETPAAVFIEPERYILAGVAADPAMTVADWPTVIPGALELGEMTGHVPLSESHPAFVVDEPQRDR
jgi:hypothetical protein